MNIDTKHFKVTEFKCRRCGADTPNPAPARELLAVLELVRLRFNKPVKINSGFRCPTHNKLVGGAKDSQHMYATASDISIDGVKPSDVYAFLCEIFPNSYGVGLYSTFVHVDVRVGKARWKG